MPQALKGCPASKDPVRRTDRPTFKIGLIVIGLLQEGLEVVEDFLLPQVVKDFLCVVFPGQSFSGKQSDKPLRTLPPSVPHIPHTHPTDQSTGRQTFSILGSECTVLVPRPASNTQGSGFFCAWCPQGVLLASWFQVHPH